VRPERLGKLKKFVHLIGTRDLPACTIVPQPLRYRVPQNRLIGQVKIISVILYLMAARVLKSTLCSFTDYSYYNVVKKSAFVQLVKKCLVLKYLGLRNVVAYRLQVWA
jgi:hypothetical protein